MVLKQVFDKVITSKLAEYYFLFRHIISYGSSHGQILKEVEATNHVRVAFVVMNLSMWKMQPLVDLLLKDERFEVKIVLSPKQLLPDDEKELSMQPLRKFFFERGVSYEDYDSSLPYDLRKNFDPHLIFFPQTYEGTSCFQHDWTSFYDKLIAYVPYSIWPGKELFGFDSWFHRIAWRIYYANDLLQKYAKSVSMIHAKNSRVVGYPSADLFLNSSKDVWKLKDPNIKRIIWAPHFSIGTRKRAVEHSSFFMMSDYMVQLAEEFQDSIQIAFKPHPRLKTELYACDEWGRERTDRYYRLWETMPNTQLETGEYTDLFMSSDALIHECGSFMIEYLYSQKPCLYVIKDYDKYYSSQNKLGQNALDCHYQTETIEGIKNFIHQILFQNKDIKAQQRADFYKANLIPPYNHTVSVNIYEDIVNSLKLH